MTGLKKNSLLLLLALGLVSAACGDDDEPDSDGNDGAEDGTPTDGGDGQDGTPTDGGDGGGGDVQCVGTTYGTFTYEQLKAVAGTEGACAGDEQLKIVCEENANDAARQAGSNCYLAGNSGDALRTCTVEGGNGITGLREVAPGLTDACYQCYAESVACTVEKGCAIQCAADATSEPCLTCRIEKGCTPDFYTCSGLPMPEDV